MRAGGLLLMLAVSLTACLEPTLLHCPNDTICPIGKVCSPLGGCVVAEQLAACSPEPADGVCTLPSGGAGGCYSGVCLPVGCGNGVVEPGEACDDGNTVPGDGCAARCDSDERCGNGLLDLTASEGCDCGDADLPDAQRPPACAGQPNGDGGRCTASCQIVGCGDGVTAGLEDCDGPDLEGSDCSDAGFYSGTLGCLPSCKFDTALCTGRCGDDVRDAAEICDGDDLNGLDCTDFGFYEPAGLGCNVACGVDTDACVGRCNDGVFQNGFEQCDPSAGLAVPAQDCTDYGFYAPEGLTCGASCLPDTKLCGGGRCGDGVINGGEDCDGAQLGGNTCANVGFHKADGLACRDNCTFDYSACKERCGDGMVNGPEQCDGGAPPGMDCTDFGFYAPAGLACDASCAFVTTGCSQRCGDTVVNGAEECDGNVPADLDCTDFGFYAAAGLACTGCTFDVTSCTGGTCGDASVQSAEQCEAAVPWTEDCTDFGFYKPGMLACVGCNFSTARCTERCGDDLVNGPETCDGSPPERYQCTSLPGWSGGQLSCANGCYDTTEHCHKVGLQSVYPGIDAVIHDVWGIGDVMYAATSEGLTRTTGGAWSPIAPESSRAIWGSSLTDVIAVGPVRAGPAWGIRRFDGSAWTWTGPTGTPVELNDVSGAGGTAWAVGANGTVVRYAANAWSVVSTGMPSKTLRGVWAASATNVFVVGDDGLRYRFDGNNWIDESIATTADFTAIWGRSANEVFAVTNVGTIYTWTGSAWSPTTGSCGFGPVTLTGVGGLPGASVAMAVGYDTRNRGVVCQYAAGSWIPIDGGRPALRAVGGSERHLAVAGDNILLVSDGATWFAMPYILWAMDPIDAWGTSTTNLYLVGYDTFTGVEALFRWNGGYWEQQNGPFVPGTLAAIYGGAGWSAAVGNGGRILVSDGAGGNWQLQASGTTAGLEDVWGDSTDVYIVGTSGTLRRRLTGGTTWAQEPGVTTAESLHSVWGVPGGPVFVVGDNSTLLRKSGGTWSALPFPVAGASLRSVAGRNANDVYVSADVGIFHYDGSTWTRMGSFGVGGKLALTATGVYVLAGSVYELIGGRWLPMRLPEPDVAQGGFAFSDMLIVARSLDAPIALLGRTWSPIATETNCTDVWDDDGDGLVDCSDSDCTGSPDCHGGGACSPNAFVRCGEVYIGSTAGGATRYPYYGGNCHARDNAGPERYILVQRPTAGPITVTLGDFSSQSLDLVVPLQTAEGACAPQDGCVAVTPDPFAAGETATWSALAGWPYIVIVDGFKGASSSFSLTVSCP